MCNLFVYKTTAFPTQPHFFLITALYHHSTPDPQDIRSTPDPQHITKDYQDTTYLIPLFLKMSQNISKPDLDTQQLIKHMRSPYATGHTHAILHHLLEAYFPPEENYDIKEMQSINKEQEQDEEQEQEAEQSHIERQQRRHRQPQDTLKNPDPPLEDYSLEVRKIQQGHLVPHLVVFTLGNKETQIRQRLERLHSGNPGLHSLYVIASYGNALGFYQYYSDQGLLDQKGIQHFKGLVPLDPERVRVITHRNNQGDRVRVRETVVMLRYEGESLVHVGEEHYIGKLEAIKRYLTQIKAG